MFKKLLSILIYMIWIPVFLISGISLVLVSFISLPFFYHYDKIVCRMILSSLFVWPQFIGRFPKGGPYIIMMNHSSFIDAFIFPIMIRGRYTGVTAIENFKYPVFSSLLRRIQAIPIQRKDLKSAIESINKAEKVLEQGIHIGLLPEGTRTLTGRMGPLKKGGFHMAINTKTPILPIGISGAYKYKPKKRWYVMPCSVTVNIGEPFQPGIYPDLGLEGLMEVVEKKLKTLSGEIDEN